MKSILSILTVCFLAVAGHAQTTSSVNIIFRGVTKNTNNYEVRIDDKRYFSNTSTNNAANYTIAIDNLLTGSRALRVYRLKNNNASANAYSQNTLIYSNKFMLKEGYKMNITVKPNGSVEFDEVMSEMNSPNGSLPMPTAAFNSLKQSVQAQWSQTLKAEKIRDSFINTNNHFTSAQVRSLLDMITSDSDKLDLVKLAYPVVTDKANFAALGNMFASTNRRNEFADFVQVNGDVSSNTGTRRLISDSNFNTLTANVRGKWSQSLKGEALRDAFLNSDNYYTTAQVRQLMGLVTSESDKLDLVKLAFPVVYDAINFATLHDVFLSAANRMEFNDFIVSKGGVIANTTIKTPMSSNNFNLLLNNVQGKWSQALKADAVKDAFVNTNNFFSTAQIRQLLTLVTSENDRINLVKLAYPAVTDATNFATLYDVFASTSNRNEFNDFVVSKGGIAVSPGIKAQMSVNNFNLLVNTIQGKLSQALKTDAVRDAFVNVNNFFSTAQIRELLTMVTSERDRLDLAKQSFRSVMDPATFYLLGDLFTNSSYQSEFKDYANAQTGVTVNTTVKTPMSGMDFSILVLTVRGNLLQFLKVQAERDIFANPNNFFTSDQVKELISLINSEPNRLELAKLSYKTVTDPENFSQLNDLFQSKANKDELAEYVNTNKVVSN